jgi:hypothetical protein
MLIRFGKCVFGQIIPTYLLLRDKLKLKKNIGKLLTFWYFFRIL